ncbi:MAG TPA: 3-deoxy-D-manno-octulosonic acid transferase, partial [Lacipirellula sp.]
GAWWGAANIGFVGGSFGSRGGQNMLEPAAYGVATCFGPNTWNFRDIVAQLLAAKGARVVRTSIELEEFVQWALQQPADAQALGQRARQLVQSQQGATRRTVDLLMSLIDEPRAELRDAA